MSELSNFGVEHSHGCSIIARKVVIGASFDQRIGQICAYFVESDTLLAPSALALFCKRIALQRKRTQMDAGFHNPHRAAAVKVLANP
jgi:hypothetical protein